MTIWGSFRGPGGPGDPKMATFEAILGSPGRSWGSPGPLEEDSGISGPSGAPLRLFCLMGLLRVRGGPGRVLGPPRGVPGPLGPGFDPKIDPKGRFWVENRPQNLDFGSKSRFWGILRNGNMG